MAQLSANNTVPVSWPFSMVRAICYSALEREYSNNPIGNLILKEHKDLVLQFASECKSCPMWGDSRQACQPLKDKIEEVVELATSEHTTEEIRFWWLQQFHPDLHQEQKVVENLYNKLKSGSIDGLLREGFCKITVEGTA